MFIMSIKTIVWLIVLAFSAPATASGPVPKIDSLAYGAAGGVQIRGKHFGPRCPTCEVLVRYSPVLLYAAAIKTWSESRIEIELPDLNQEKKMLGIQVKNAIGISRSKSIQLKRRYSVIKSERRSHSLAVGDKGEDRFNVTGSSAVCGKESKAFDHAEVNFIKRRFADAQIVRSPAPGCKNCNPVVVRWYNEPTGSLTYELMLIGRIVQGVCEKKVRSNS